MLKKIIIAVSIISIIIASIFLFMSNDNDDSVIIEYQTLGEQLDNNEWILFVQEGCPACITQKDLIANEITGLKIIDCGESAESANLCYETNITAIPTWYNTKSNESIVAILNVTQLNDMIESNKTGD